MFGRDKASETNLYSAAIPTIAVRANVATTRAPAAIAHELTVRLHDGRALGYAEFGDRAGTPVFYFHGTPGSRLEATLLADAASRQHIRLIAVDRPGFGLSDFLPKRRFSDWPGDLLELADALRIDRFGIVGLSGGGPHAAACALKLGDRMTAAAIVSGAGPPEAIVSEKGMVRRLISRFVMRFAPATTRISLWFAEQGLRHLPAWAITRFPDPKVLGRSAVRKAFQRDVVEGFRHGVRGAVAEYHLFARNWEFRLEEIDADVHVWHGEKDRVVPVAVGRYVAGAIPNAGATFVSDAGHLMIVDIADDVFAELRQQGG